MNKNSNWKSFRVKKIRVKETVSYIKSNAQIISRMNLVRLRYFIGI